MKSIYVILNKTNGKQYVGQSKNPQRRFRAHCLCRRSGIGKAIRKHGEGAFEFIEVITDLDADTANLIEEVTIEYMDSFKNGYNNTPSCNHKPKSLPPAYALTQHENGYLYWAKIQ